MTFTPEVWDGVLRRLQREVPPFSYQAWLAPLEPRPGQERLILLCQSSFHRDRVRHHFLPQIHRCLEAEIGGEIAVELDIAARQRGPAPDPGPASSAPRSSPASPSTRPHGGAEPVAPVRNLPPRPGRGQAARRPGASPARGADAPDAAMRPAAATPAPAQQTFETFVVGPCNALAREAALAIAKGEQRGLNQLYLCSPAGMGKTHLSRAVADAAKRLGAGEVRYVSAERFTNEFLGALHSRKTADFKRRYRKRRQLLVLEDVQFLESKQATQLEFFHTVSHVLDTGGKVVLTGDRMPHEMPQLAPRVRSQLAAGFVAELEAPDAQVRRAILRSRAAHGGVKLPGDCLDLLVESVEGSVRDLESVLVQLVNSATLLKRPIDAALTRDAIEKKSPRSRRPARRLEVAEVIQVVAGFFQTTSEQLASRSRRRDVLLPRQLAMYLCRRYTEGSVAEIGAALRRDHPSVRNATEKIERAMLERAPLRYQVEALCARLDSMLGPTPGDTSC